MKARGRAALLIAGLQILSGVKPEVSNLLTSVATAAESYREPWRPQFHFTPERNWMNDPNGLVFFEGEYHLFYQYNPEGNKWGHMSWGHAVSRDLVHWEHLPVALFEENGVMIFSGSAVVDWKNTSGFASLRTATSKPPLVSIYTGHYTKKPLQNQHIAWSIDRGRTWTKFAGNPVLDIGEKDFRDPKVFWHEPTQRWVMVVAWPVQRKVRLYSSPNLKEWTHLSDFGPAGSTKGIWECPDLFPLQANQEKTPQQGVPTAKWILIVNVGSGAPAGGSGSQYFVGEFDGTQFTLDKREDGSTGVSPSREPLWADYGRDFYAAVSWSDIPKRDGRRLTIGWMSNWEYANDVPTAPWRSAMSLPRELSLRNGTQGPRLIQKPVRELRKLRTDHRRFNGGSIAEANAWLKKRAISGDQLEVKVEFAAGGHDQEGLKVLKGTSEETIITVDRSRGRVVIDRSKGGRNFHPKFPGRHEAPLPASNGIIRLHIFVDTSSVEVFLNDGEAILTDLVFPSPESRGLEFFGPGDGKRVRSLEVWRLKSIWK